MVHLFELHLQQQYPDERHRTRSISSVLRLGCPIESSAGMPPPFFCQRN